MRYEPILSCTPYYVPLGGISGQTGAYWPLPMALVVAE
jgi:hypothetical protein